MRRSDVCREAGVVLAPPIHRAVSTYWRRHWMGVRIYIPRQPAVIYARRAHPLSGTLRWLCGTEAAIRRGGGSEADNARLLRHIGGGFVSF